jgi:hypothetical protein
MRRLKFSVRGKFVRWVRQQSGVDVMIGIFWAIFANFRRKNGAFVKNQCFDQIFDKTSTSLGKNTQKFLLIFWGEFF